MSALKKVRRAGEAALILVGMVTIPLLPRPVIVWLAKALGRAACGLSRTQRRVARANLDIAYGDTLDGPAKERIVRGAFFTFALLALDLFWFSMFTRRRIPRYTAFDDSAKPYFDTEGPVIVITGHFGNWEVMGQAAALEGAPTVSVATPLDNTFANWFVNRARRATGQEIQPREGAMKGLMRVLQKEGRVALLLDQNTLPREGGIFVDFFGHPVPVSKAPAFLATRTEAALVIGVCLPDERGRYRMYGSDMFHVAGKSIEDATQIIMDGLEEIIRQHPDRWLWMYKRWKYVPPERKVSEFPFYSRRPSW